MKKLIKLGGLAAGLWMISACQSDQGWQNLAEHKRDQKSYAIGYSATAQTYADRVNDSYDIDSFMRGTSDWFKRKIKLPIEQIRMSLFNRMLNHDTFAYYSGVLYAAELQANSNRLSPNCWSLFIDETSLTKGVFDAMQDIRQNHVRHDDYLKAGVEQIFHLCIEQMEKEQQPE